MQQPGEVLDLECGSIAHGGHVVARDRAGRVVFVRHALPGEHVQGHLTRVGPGGRWASVDATKILQPHPRRVTPECAWSGPGRCGGCDLQHASLPLQRELKGTVVAEQFARLAHLEVEVSVLPLTDRGGARCAAGLGAIS